MATSGVSTWNLNTAQIINGALRLLSAIQSGETPPDEEYEEALEALNALTKFWQSLGIHVWSQVDATLFLQPGQIRYLLGGTTTDHVTLSPDWTQTALAADAAASATTIVVASAAAIVQGDQIGIWLDAGTTFWSTVASTLTTTTVALTTGLPSAATSGNYVVSYLSALVRPLKVPAARRYLFAAPDGQPIEIPMIVMSQIDYANVPNKVTPGTPTQFYFQPELGQAVMNIWPAPSNNLSAIKFTAQQPLQDFVNQANTADLPAEWISTLRYNLAVELAPEYDTPMQRFEMIKSIADQKLEMSRSWDRPPEPVLFGVSTDPTSRT